MKDYVKTSKLHGVVCRKSERAWFFQTKMNMINGYTHLRFDLLFNQLTNFSAVSAILMIVTMAILLQCGLKLVWKIQTSCSTSPAEGIHIGPMGLRYSSVQANCFVGSVNLLICGRLVPPWVSRPGIISQPHGARNKEPECTEMASWLMQI